MALDFLINATSTYLNAHDSGTRTYTSRATAHGFEFSSLPWITLGATTAAMSIFLIAKCFQKTRKIAAELTELTQDLSNFLITDKQTSITMTARYEDLAELIASVDAVTEDADYILT